MATESDSPDMSFSTIEVSHDGTTVALFSGTPDGKPPAEEPAQHARQVFDVALLDALRRIDLLERECADVNRAFNDAIVRAVELERRLVESTARLAAADRAHAAFLTFLEREIERLESERDAMISRARHLQARGFWKIRGRLRALRDRFSGPRLR